MTALILTSHQHYVSVTGYQQHSYSFKMAGQSNALQMYYPAFCDSVIALCYSTPLF